MKIHFGNFFFVSLTLILLSACRTETPQVTKENVKYWSHETLSSLSSEFPPSFTAIRQSAILPQDFNFKKQPEDFGEEPDQQFMTETLNASLIRDMGLISVIGEHCALDWNEQNFLPMMQWQREFLPKDERKGYKIYVIGFSHGYAMGSASEWIEENQIDCKDVEMKLKDNFFTDIF